MILNLDQTPIKYALCSRHILVKKKEKQAAVAGNSHLTFVKLEFLESLNSLVHSKMFCVFSSLFFHAFSKH